MAQKWYVWREKRRHSVRAHTASTHENDTTNRFTGTTGGRKMTGQRLGFSADGDAVFSAHRELSGRHATLPDFIEP